jgi:hypothetical protein
MAKRGGKGGSSSEFNAAAGNQPVEAEYRPGSGYVHPETGMILSGQEIDAAKQPGGSGGVTISENNGPTPVKDSTSDLVPDVGNIIPRLARRNRDGAPFGRGGRVRRVPATEKATVKGQRAEQTESGTIGTRTFRSMLDLHSKVIGDALRQLHAVAARGDRPGRLSPLGQPEDSPLHGLAHENLNEAEGHYANATFSMQLGDDYNNGTNLTRRNVSETQSNWDAHPKYKEAMSSLLKAHEALHKDGTIAQVLSSNKGTMPHTFTEDQVAVAKNAMDILPTKKKGDEKKSVQVGPKIALKYVKPALREAGIQEGSEEWDNHINDAMSGNVKKGGPLHQIMINRAQASGDRSLISRVNRMFSGVSRLTTGARRNQRAAIGLGKGQRAGSSREMAAKVMDDVKTTFANADASGTKLNMTLDQFLEAGAPQVGRKEDPKKEVEKKGAGTLSADRIEGPKLGVNVTNTTAGEAEAGRRKVIAGVRQQNEEVANADTEKAIADYANKKKANRKGKKNG